MRAVDVVYEGADGPWIVARVAQRGSETFVEYTDEHVATGADLAPLKHPLDQRSRSFPGATPEHLPGLLSDAGPDSWGRSVLRRDMRRHGIDAPEPLDMLTWLGRRTMGALTFRPVEGPEPADVALVELDRLQEEALRHLAGQDTHDQAAEAVALAAGGSAGGARPKITAARSPEGELIVDNGDLPPGSTPWLVKFHGQDDSASLSVVEASYLEMARTAGISTCEHKLLPGNSGTQYLAVRRFDRIVEPGAQPGRVHMATAAGLLEAYPDLGQHVGYHDVIRLTRRVTGDVRETTEMVRRAVFNVVAHNRDDHARNIAYLWTPADGWRLAPAFDLTFSLGPRPTFAVAGPGEHYLDVAGKGASITRDDLVGLHKPAGLEPHVVADMVDEAVAAVDEWPTVADRNGVDADTIEHAAARLPALGR